MPSRPIVAAVALVAAACAGRAPTADAPDPVTAVPAMLHASAQAWNRGDLERFLEDYADEPTTTFVGASVVRGIPEIRRRYEAGYFADGALPDSLRFEDIEVRRLGPEHALAIGRFVLTSRQTGQLGGTGYFSLVLEHTPAGWRIIHDHSSSS